MITVIIPTRNRRNMLAKAISSIENQIEVETEIIIVDDASTDDTEYFIKRLKDSRIVYIKNENPLFAHESRKKGYQAAKGDYIVFMDDDDYYIDDSFFKDVETIFKNYKSVCAVIGSTTRVINGKYEDTIDLCGNGKIENRVYFNGFSSSFNKPLSTLSSVFRKRSLDRINFGQFRMVNDTCIYLMGILGGDIYLLNKSVAAYRVHSNNISKAKFKKNFISNCLKAKLEIFDLATNEKLIDSPKKWLGEQLSQSALYFISSSQKDISTALYILLWLALNSRGSQFVVARCFMSKIL